MSSGDRSERRPVRRPGVAGREPPVREFRDGAAQLARSVREESDRDSLSCSLALLWRQHLEVRLGQLVATAGALLDEPEAGAAAPARLEELWPRARELLDRLCPALRRDLPQADSLVQELLRAWGGPSAPRVRATVDLGAFHDGLTRVAVLLDDAGERLGRKLEWKDDALSWID